MIVCLLLSAFGLTCKAQELRLVERLADGSIIVTLDGVEFRGFNDAKMGELLKQKRDLEDANKTLAEKDTQIKEALLQRDLAQAREALEKERAAYFEKDFNRAREDADRWHSLFVSERELRQEAGQFVAHGSKTKFDKFLALFDSKAVQFAIKGLAPIWTAVRCQ